MFSVHLCRLRIARKKLNLLRGGIGVTFSFIEYTPQSFWGSPIARDILAVTELIVYKFAGGKRA